MDNVNITTVENGEVVQQKRNGLQVRTKRINGETTFINSSGTSTRRHAAKRTQYDVVSFKHVRTRPAGALQGSKTNALGAMASDERSEGDGKHGSRSQKAARQLECLEWSNVPESFSPALAGRFRDLAASQCREIQRLPMPSDYRLPFYVQDADQKCFLMCLAVSTCAKSLVIQLILLFSTSPEAYIKPADFLISTI
jgi:hypothetical protein